MEQYPYPVPQVAAPLGHPNPIAPPAVQTMAPPAKAKPVPRPGAGPKKPKRPKTAYHFFYDAERKAALEAAPDAKAVDNNLLSRQLGIKWKAMGAPERVSWDALAKGAKEDYDVQVRLFEQQGGRMHDVNPTKPLSAYMLYFRAKHEACKHGPKTPDFAKATGAEWKALSEGDKQPFHDSAKKQRDLYDNQVAFCARSGQGVVGEKFLDGRSSVMAFARVAGYESGLSQADDLDEARAAYHVVYDDAARGAETLSFGELKARACGDERAAKRAAARVDAATKKRKAAPLLAPPPLYEVPPLKKPKKERKPPPLADGEPAPLADDEVHHVIRLARRLAGGASVANLKKLCAAGGLATSGSKAALASRLERFLRTKGFEHHPFSPSHADCLGPIDRFNAKHESQPVYKIGDVEAVVAGL